LALSALLLLATPVVVPTVAEAETAPGAALSGSLIAVRDQCLKWALDARNGYPAGLAQSYCESRFELPDPFAAKCRLYGDEGLPTPSTRRLVRCTPPVRPTRRGEADRIRADDQPASPRGP